MDQRILEFIGDLRRAEIRISPSEALDALSASAEVGLTDRETFKSTLAATLVKESRDLPTFDRLFNLYFLDLEALGEGLQKALGLDSLPLRIECFDISHLGGTHTTSSMVVFEGGAAKKSDYRRFNIREVEPGDDYGAMAEVLTRRYAQWEKQNERSPYDADRDASFAALPNVVVIDGGKGQLAAGLEPLQGFRERGVTVISLAKRIEEVFLPGKTEPIVLPHDTPELQLLQRVRDEAHRFAITHHRIRRDKAMTESIMDDLPGIGPARKRTLLKHFGSPEAVLAASREELERVPGFPQKVARALYAHLNKTGR